MTTRKTIYTLIGTRTAAGQAAASPPSVDLSSHGERVVSPSCVGEEFVRPVMILQAT
jgi:hypothetical protein